MEPTTRLTLPQIVVAVGTDHHPFDRLIEWIDDYAGIRTEATVLVQRGTSSSPANCSSVDLLPHGALCERFATSVAAVSHGGPSTVMDARMAGRLPIVVARDPRLGEHVDEHQIRFTRHLGRHGLARVAEDRESLHALLDEALTNPDHFTVPVEEASLAGVREFARVVDELLGITTPLAPPSLAGVVDERSLR
jgi:UDP-N-acetylglucosamine transferase subunit ALG13